VAALATVLGLVPAIAGADLRPPAGSELCYGRAFDGAQLSRAPGQTIAEIYLARLDRPDPELEVVPAPNESASFAPQFTLLARLRDPQRRFRGMVECGRAEGVSFTCAVECDGGGFEAQRDEDGLNIQFGPRGVRVGRACADSAVMVGSRPADRSIRLAALPVDACLAAREAARPGFVRHGPPLRVSLKARGTSCFSRRYDQVHLSRNPEQRVTAIAVRAEWHAEAASGDWIGLDLSIRLRDGSERRSEGRCDADQYAFTCERVGGMGAFVLTRGPSSGVMVRDSLSDPDGTSAPAGLSAFVGAALGSGDDVFRLEPAAMDECGG
jgi:hypothetical protein